MCIIQNNRTTASDNWVGWSSRYADSVKTGWGSYKQRCRKELHVLGGWQSHSLPILDPLLSAHWSPGSHWRHNNTQIHQWLCMVLKHELTNSGQSDFGRSGTYHWKVAVLFSKTWQVIILKSFQNIVQVINLEIRELVFRNSGNSFI